MKGTPYQAEKHGQVVWVSPLLEEIRGEECLCWNCSRLKPQQPDNCSIAESLYRICVEYGVATPVTRCPVWQPKQV